MPPISASPTSLASCGCRVSLAGTRCSTSPASWMSGKLTLHRVRRVQRMRRHYDEDRWLGQPYYPVLIVEKDTMEPVCKPMARRWQMPFASSRGYSSLKLQHDVAEMLNAPSRQDRATSHHLFRVRPRSIGLDLQRAWQEAMDNFGVCCRLVRIGSDARTGGTRPRPRPPRHRGQGQRQPLRRLSLTIRRPLLGNRRSAACRHRAGHRRRHPVMARCQAVEAARRRDRARQRASVASEPERAPAGSLS